MCRVDFFLSRFVLSLDGKEGSRVMMIERVFDVLSSVWVAKGLARERKSGETGVPREGSRVFRGVR